MIIRVRSWIFTADILKNVKFFIAFFLKDISFLLLFFKFFCFLFSDQGWSILFEKFIFILIEYKFIINYRKTKLRFSIFVVMQFYFWYFTFFNFSFVRSTLYDIFIFISFDILLERIWSLNLILICWMKGRVVKKCNF